MTEYIVFAFKTEKDLNNNNPVGGVVVRAEYPEPAVEKALDEIGYMNKFKHFGVVARNNYTKISKGKGPEGERELMLW